jgi:hypothetical protein
VARDRWRQGRVGAGGLVLVEERHLVLDPVPHGDRAPQRDALGGVPAHVVLPAVDLGLHVEGRVRDPRDLIGRRGDALLLQVGRELAARQRDLREVLGHGTDDVVLAVEEGEPARLVLVDHIHLDAADDGQALALQARCDLARAGVVAGFALEELLAEVGVRLQHDLRAACPALQQERARAHGVRVEIVAVILGHLPRHGRSRWHRESTGEPEVGGVEPMQRVSVEGPQLDGWS